MDARPLTQQLQERHTQLTQERANWVPHWKTLSEHLLPRSGRFTTSDRNKGGADKFNSIIDSTGTKALHTLGAGLMAGMTSPARPWFRLATSDEDLMESEDVQDWLATVTRTMLEIFHRSNTYRALHSLYEELGCFGTGATIILPNYDTVVHHHSLTAGEYSLATDANGRVNTMMREFDMTVAQVVREFGIDNVSANVKSLYNKSQLGNWITVIHAIEPRDDRDVRMKDNKNKKFRSTYFEFAKNSDRGGDTVLRDGGFDRFPVLGARWMVHGGDVYGTSPGMEALGDVKQLQHQQLRKAEGIDYQTRPPLAVPASMKGHEIDTLPGGVMYYDGQGTQTIKSAFDVNLNMQHLLMDIQDVRERIRSSFYADLFMMIANDQRSGVTAREISERHEEKLLMLGPVLERLHDELLSPLIDITFDHMITVDMLPKPPPQMNGIDLKVEFVSMLAQAQRAVGVAGVERLTTYVGQLAMAKQDPSVWDNLDTDQLINGYADMTGVDPKFIVGNEKMALIRGQREQQQQQQQAIMMAQQAAETASTMGNTPTKSATGEESNALSDITRQFTQL